MRQSSPQDLSATSRTSSADAEGIVSVCPTRAIRVPDACNRMHAPRTGGAATGLSILSGGCRVRRETLWAMRSKLLMPRVISGRAGSRGCEEALMRGRGRCTRAQAARRNLVEEGGRVDGVAGRCGGRCGSWSSSERLVDGVSGLLACAVKVAKGARCRSGTRARRRLPKACRTGRVARESHCAASYRKCRAVR